MNGPTVGGREEREGREERARGRGGVMDIRGREERCRGQRCGGRKEIWIKTGREEEEEEGFI